MKIRYPTMIRYGDNFVPLNMGNWWIRDQNTFRHLWYTVNNKENKVQLTSKSKKQACAAVRCDIGWSNSVMVSFAPSSTLRYIYPCSICKQFSSINTSGGLRHIGVVHSYEANFYLTCGIDGCPWNYHNYHSFRKLVRRHHPQRKINEKI